MRYWIFRIIIGYIWDAIYEMEFSSFVIKLYYMYSGK